MAAKIANEWDYLLFVFLMSVVLLGIIRFMYRSWLSLRDNSGMRVANVAVVIVTASIFCGGWFLIDHAEKREYERTKGILISNAPILAYELSKQGHGELGINTSDDDSRYLRMIQSMVDWMSLNSHINSIYTMRKLDGRNVFILGPETDYNQNGHIDDDIEARVPIGEVYEERIPELEESFRGFVTFQSEVTEDQWGRTISAFVPILDASGRTEAVLGLDFDGNLFLKNVGNARLGMIGIVFSFLLILYGAFTAGVYYFGNRQNRRHQGELQHQAYHDALTGLPNRTLLRQQLCQTLAGLPGQAHTAAVLFLDVDRFKNVNDSLGHIVGDLLLQRLAERLSAALDGNDLLARPGGDELIVLLRDVPGREDVLRKAEKLRALFDEPFVVGEYSLYITASIGVSIYPAGGKDADTMMRNADTAMYFAKERGSLLHIYTEDMNRKLLKRLEIENDLRKALERDEFVLFYQPKVDVRSGKTVGMEALIRWNHPEKGFVSPFTFISVAEDTGLIVPIGEWVIKEACRQLKEWESQGFRPIPISVNLSARQFQKKDLVLGIQNIIEQFQVNPAFLELELTESSIMQSPELSSHTLYLLKKSGLGIALDDFGTGYSSLSYLRSFPLDVLKIDKGFVKDVTKNSDNAAIVTSIIKLAHNLGLKVICEGVETEEQLDFLRDKKCDQIQGYYYSPPIPPEDFVKWLTAENDEEGLHMADIS